MNSRDEFLSALRREFPEAYDAIDDIASGLLHCEMSIFRETVEDACHSGRAWYVEQAMRFVERELFTAGPYVANAIEISFIEDFALGNYTPEAREVVLDRTPPSILARLRKVHEFWVGS